VAAQQGHGAGDQPHQRVQPQQGRQADPDGVLHPDEHRNHHQKNEQCAPAFLEFGEVGTQTNGGKEHQHEGRLQLTVEAQAVAQQGIQQVAQGRGHQAAGHGLRNVEVAQPPQVPHQPLAQQQDDDGTDQGVVGVEVQVHEGLGGKRCKETSAL